MYIAYVPALVIIEVEKANEPSESYKLSVWWEFKT